jgi:hypothetical protein
MAHDLIDSNTLTYTCDTTDRTNCIQCHNPLDGSPVPTTDILYHFVYATKTTKWHGQHQSFGTYLYGAAGCNMCHTGAASDCTGKGLVQTINCKLCHNLTPQTFTNPNSPPAIVTPAAESLPCDWVNNHDILHPERGTNCLNCHTSCATVIELTSFTATERLKNVIIVWETASEIVNAGFNIYRSTAENGAYEKINASLIPAKGSAYKGASYGYVDKDVQKNITYYYKLEDIDISGTSTFHGPIVATPKRGR